MDIAVDLDCVVWDLMEVFLELYNFSIQVIHLNRCAKGIFPHLLAPN